ncbi:hypothetical protein GQ44DRAFT_583107, partial [Phaeosphaeriaceae sp. PMI808]
RKSWFASFMNRNNDNDTLSNQPPVNDSPDSNEDEWHDFSDEDSNNETESSRLLAATDSSSNPHLEPALLSQMPSLFSKTLPPCGPKIQVAYENIVHCLRNLWIQHAAKGLSDISTLYICHQIKEDIDRENQENPVTVAGSSSLRVPWRSTVVFKYELRWVNYFVREADVLERWPRMSLIQQQQQEFENTQYAVPRELLVTLRRTRNRAAVRALWEEWHEEKRG